MAGPGWSCSGCCQGWRRPFSYGRPHAMLNANAFECILLQCSRARSPLSHTCFVCNRLYLPVAWLRIHAIIMERRTRPHTAWMKYRGEEEQRI